MPCGAAWSKWRLGSAMFGRDWLLKLHPRAWNCPPHSGGAAQHLTSHREDVAVEPRTTKLTNFAAFDRTGGGHPSQALLDACAPMEGSYWSAMQRDFECLEAACYVDKLGAHKVLIAAGAVPVRLTTPALARVTEHYSDHVSAIPDSHAYETVEPCPVHLHL